MVTERQRGRSNKSIVARANCYGYVFVRGPLVGQDSARKVPKSMTYSRLLRFGRSVCGVSIANVKRHPLLVP